MKVNKTNKIIFLILLLLTSRRIPAGAITWQDSQQHSIVVLVDGEKMIQLPNGRVIPFGQGTICSGEICLPTITPPANHRLLIGTVIILLTGACLALCRNLQEPPSFLPVLPPSLPTPPSTPPVNAPEPATLLLLGLGLILVSRRLKRINYE